MKITVNQLRKIIKEEINLVSEMNFDPKQTVDIPPVKQRKEHVPVGKRQLPQGFNVQDLLDQMTEEQKEEMLAALQTRT